jgi:hypothetical protein
MSIILIGAFVLIVWALLIWCVRTEPKPWTRKYHQGSDLDWYAFSECDPDEVERRMGLR